MARTEMFGVERAHKICKWRVSYIKQRGIHKRVLLGSFERELGGNACGGTVLDASCSLLIHGCTRSSTMGQR